MVSALVGMVAAIAAPILGDVSAGPRVPTAVESTLPDDGGASPETTVPATEPTPTGPSTTESDAPATTIEAPAPPTTETAPAPTAATTTPETAAPLPTLAPAPTPETTVPDTALDGAVGPAGAGDTYAVTVEAVCGTGYHPAVHIDNESTADVRVSVGPQSMVLGVGEQWQLDWPTTDGDPPLPDPAPRWDAVRLDGIPPEVFDEGTLSLPAECPPTGPPSAPRDLASTATNASVGLSWVAPESDGGSAITDYTIEHNALPFEDDDWTLVNDGVGTGTTANVVGLTNGETYLFRVRAVTAIGPGVSAGAKDTPNVTPTAPGSVAVVPTVVRGQLRLSWNAPAMGFDIFLYEVERSLDNATWAPLTEVGGNTTAYLDAGLVRTQRYYYRVTAHNSAGPSPASAVVNGVPNDVPTAPRTLTAIATNLSGQIRLSWVVPLSTGGSPVIDYTVQRSANGTSGWLDIRRNVIGTSHLVTGLPNGTRFYFRVLARNAPGTSPVSNGAHAVPRSVPSAPRSLTATATGLTGQVRLAWLAPLSTGGSTITDYVVYRSPNGTSNWTWVNDGVNTATSYTVTGLGTGTRYYFRILARNAAGLSPPSNVPSAVPANQLTAPRNLVAAPTNVSGQVRLSWLVPWSSGGAAITDYVIQRSPNGSTWITIADGVNTRTTYTVTGLANGARYHFRVLARNSRAWSPSSNVVNAIPRTVPTAPRNLTGISTAEYDYLNWDVPASNGGSAIIDYIGEVWDGVKWFRMGSVTTTEGYIDVDGNGCSDYRIAARNAVGIGPFAYVFDVCYP